jgi:transcriptional regulator with XRE-family HTH domain
MFLDGYRGGAVTYGERLRELRAERQLSLRQVEERGGPNKDTMSLIERGVHKPHAQTLGRIAKAFDMSVAGLRAELEAAERPLAQAPFPFEDPTSAELPGLKAARELRGMRLNELAVRSGASVQEISELEEGSRKADTDLLDRLIAALGHCWKAELMFPRDQFEAFLAETKRENVVEADLSKLSPETALAVRRALKRISEGIRKIDEERARQQPEAG